MPESTPKKKPRRVRVDRVFSDDSLDDFKEGNVPHEKPVKPKAVKKECAAAHSAQVVEEEKHESE